MGQMKLLYLLFVAIFVPLIICCQGSHIQVQRRQAEPVASAHLLFKQQTHAVNHLVPIKRSGCDVEEEAVENGLGDPLKGNGQHER